MSTEEQDAIQTTQIDGDVSVGRNVALGGGFISQGKGRVKGDLVVDGWLDAKNIKGVFKGIYLTVEKLKADFPEPEGPIMERISPSLTETEISLMTSRPSNSFLI